MKSQYVTTLRVNSKGLYDLLVEADNNWRDWVKFSYYDEEGNYYNIHYEDDIFGKHISIHKQDKYGNNKDIIKRYRNLNADDFQSLKRFVSDFDKQMIIYKYYYLNGKSSFDRIELTENKYYRYFGEETIIFGNGFFVDIKNIEKDFLSYLSNIDKSYEKYDDEGNLTVTKFIREVYLLNFFESLRILDKYRFENDEYKEEIDKIYKKVKELEIRINKYVQEKGLVKKFDSLKKGRDLLKENLINILMAEEGISNANQEIECLVFYNDDYISELEKLIDSKEAGKKYILKLKEMGKHIEKKVKYFLYEGIDEDSSLSVKINKIDDCFLGYLLWFEGIDFNKCVFR